MTAHEMAKFPKKASPAREALDHFGRWLPGIWHELEALRLQSGASPADAPVNAAFIETIRQAMAKNVPPGTPLPAPDSLALKEIALVYSALAAWRYTQGIYRFDPDLYAAVTDTPITDIPVHVLDHIPEWCIYIETPALKLWGDSVAGAWVRVAGGNMLCIYAQTEINPLAPALFHISLSDGIERSIQQAVDRLGGDESDAAEASRVLPHIINLVLYLCASNDITGKFGQPGNPKPVRTRRAGWQLFPVDGIRAWDVGVRMGNALRDAYQRAVQ